MRTRGRREEAVQEETRDEYTAADQIGQIILDHLGLTWDQVTRELYTFESEPRNLDDLEHISIKKSFFLGGWSQV
jgi:hypothetical protein